MEDHAFRARLLVATFYYPIPQCIPDHLIRCPTVPPSTLRVHQVKPSDVYNATCVLPIPPPSVVGITDPIPKVVL